MQFTEQRGHRTITATVERRARIEYVGYVRKSISVCVDKVDRAVQARIAIINKRLFTKLNTGQKRRRSCRHLKQVVLRQLEVNHLQFGLVVTTNGNQSPLYIRVGATAEWIEGCWRWIVQRFLHQRIGDAVVRDVFFFSPRPGDRCVPVPVFPVTAEALQNAEGLAVIVDDPRYLRPAVVVDDQRPTSIRQRTRTYDAVRQPIR